MHRQKLQERLQEINKINEVRKTELRGSAGLIHSIGPGMKQGLKEFKPLR